MNLSDRSPRVGDALVLHKEKWEITDVSTYKDKDGYRVTEWCCETGQAEAYLLRESTGGAARWFFTRWIEPAEVASPEGAPLQLGWSDGKPVPKAPESLVSGGETFTFDDTTDGMYEGESGGKVRKLTWDYWNLTRTVNLCIELWGDGGVDFYRGAYIQDAEGEIRSARSSGVEFMSSRDRFLAAAIFTPLWYLVPLFFLEMPFDQGIVFAVPVAAFTALRLPPFLPVPYYAGAVALAAALAALFSRFPPFSHFIGMAAVFAGPWLASALAKGRDDCGWDHVRYLVTVSSAFPAFGWGAYHYFTHAPMPHTFGQLVLAMLPAVFAGLAAFFISGAVLPAEVEAPQ